MHADDKEPKEMPREMLVITDMAFILQKAPQMKTNAEEVPTLKKKQRSTPSGLSSELSELLQIKREKIADDKQYKIV